jgi:hypothetical protein
MHTSVVNSPRNQRVPLLRHTPPLASRQTAAAPPTGAGDTPMTRFKAC